MAENRARAAAVFEVELPHLLTCYQVHSATAVTAERPWGERPEADAVVTRTRGLVCGALAADCAPVLLADSEARVVGAAHAGWRGALGGIVAATVEAMQRLGAQPGRIVAAIGPCIGPDSYEVGAEYREHFLERDPSSERFFRETGAADKRLFDLPGYVLDRLDRAGVGSAEWIGRDTVAEPDQFFSNRRAIHRQETDYGRLLSAISLEH